MQYTEHDFADMLFAWPAVEGRIIHLYELDPTHAAALPSGGVNDRPSAALPVQPARSAALYCALADIAPASLLLELDPTHTHAD